MNVDSVKYCAPLGEQLPAEAVRQIQLEILAEFVRVCDEHGLTYYLSGGTLLGAVRHAGFIPWDDDIDVNMPRPDCDRLIELTRGLVGEHFAIGSPLGPIVHSKPYLRMYDRRYVLRSESVDGRVTGYTNVFIDIFPIEGLPEGRGAIFRRYLLARSFIMLSQLAFYGGVSGEVSARRLGKLALVPFARLFGYRFWNRCLVGLARACDYNRADTVGVMTIYHYKEWMKKEYYGSPTAVMFEGIKYAAPADPDRYLTILYGDYMQLPPEEKRKSHHCFAVFRA